MERDWRETERWLETRERLRDGKTLVRDRLRDGKRLARDREMVRDS